MGTRFSKGHGSRDPEPESTFVEVYLRVATVLVVSGPNARTRAFEKWANVVDANPGTYYLVELGEKTPEDIEQIIYDGRT